MKKFTFAIVLMVSIGLLALKDNEVCPGLLGHKSLACSACHGGSISGEVFIIDGKVDDEYVEVWGNEYVIRIPSDRLGILQLFSSTKEQVYGASNVAVDVATSLWEVKGNTLFNPINLTKQKSSNGRSEITIRYVFDEPITKAKTMILQGVFSNNDGTAEGDQTFYKEITIQAKNEGIQGSNLSLAFDQAYYNGKQVIISNPGKIEAVQILDLQGKIVRSVVVEDYQNIDVSELQSGMYLVLIGNNRMEMQRFKFVK